MKKFVRIVFMLSLFLLSASEALSCSCADPSVREKFRAANSVFIGQVIEMTPFPPNDDFPPAEYMIRFKVERQWKGSKKSEVVAISDFDRPGWCGDLNLAVGRRYLIYAHRKKGRLLIYTDCGPNMNIQYAGEEIKRLNNRWFRVFAHLYPYPDL